MKELKLILRHAGTVLLGQLAVMAFGVADTVIAGRYSDTALAALSVGSAIYISVYVGLIGVIQALLPIWAQMRGAQQQAQPTPSLMVPINESPVLPPAPATQAVTPAKQP